ncbi:MAG: hypothetical protein U9N55_05665 [candidate division Zixibacteria bacterium]|nr:hypothetical protein [candidate division Zixibacteria bacterium]
MNLRKSVVAIMLGMVTIAILSVSVLYIAGCTDSLEGDIHDNQKPIVRFVNIPPEGQNFSINPIVNWYGTDNDGLIAYYRYHIAIAADIGDMPPEDYVNTLSDEIFVTCNTTDAGDTISCDTTADWTYIHIDPTLADPHTSNTLSLTADPSNPVLGFVDQYVFLQAYDTKGLGSDIIWRRFKRNDNPPETFILWNPKDAPFVNSEQSGGIATGIRMKWMAKDALDYPADPPPFEFQWRLYGPYSEIDSAYIYNNFMKEVFVTTDGFIYNIGDTIIRCAMEPTDSGLVEKCDTIIVESGMGSSVLGEMDEIFDVNDPDFISSKYNIIPDSSFNGVDPWIMETSDTIYNVYKNIDTNKTVEMSFLFWVRSRDDALVPDLAPDFECVKVIEPKFENDVLLLDFTSLTSEPITSAVRKPHGPGGNRDAIPDEYYADSFHVAKFWQDLIRNWAGNDNFDAVDGDEGDYYFVYGGFNDNHGVDLKTLLSYKILILYNEQVLSSGLTIKDEYHHPIWKAIDAGVNVWSTMRAPLYGNVTSRPTSNIYPGSATMPSEYSLYFSVVKTVYSGWGWSATKKDDEGYGDNFRTEDFIGAYPIESKWPEVNMAPDLVENRMNWENWNPILGFDHGFNPELPCVPEVNWSVAGRGAEVMYLYKSIYGAGHPLGSGGIFDYVMEGNPVGHRFGTGSFRTVHFDFTPLCMDTTKVQALVDTVLNWLYEEHAEEPVSKIRYNDAGKNISLSEMRRHYWERNDRLYREETGEDAWDPKRFTK